MTDQLSSAPMMFLVLCKLSEIAAKEKDFSLDSKANPKDFKHLKFTHSYCSCLQQLCNQISITVMNSIGNMDHIHLTMNQVPQTIQKIVETLTEVSLKKTDEALYQNIAYVVIF